MPYGQGQMLGAGVDPRMFVQDYSGFARAAEIQAQGMQNLSAGIAKGIENFAEARKERKQIDAKIKANTASIESAMKLGDSLGIDLRGTLGPIYSKINDPNTTPMEALAYGEAASNQIANAITLYTGAQERQIDAQRIQQAAQQQNERADEIVGIEDIYQGDKVIQMGRTRRGELVPIGQMTPEPPVQGYVPDVPLDGTTPSLTMDGASSETGVSADGSPGVLPPLETTPPETTQLGVRPRYTTSQEQQGIVMTPEQLQQEIASGRKVNAVPVEGGNYRVTGITAGGAPLVNVSNAPTPATGYYNVFDEQGNLVKQEPIPGGPADVKEKSGKESEEKQRKYQLEIANRSLKSIDSLMEKADKMSEMSIAGPIRKGLSALGASEQADVQADISQLVSATQIETLQQMKQQSITGASGLGQINMMEFQALADIAGALRLEMRPSSLKKNLNEYKTRYLNVVYGTPEERTELVKSGRISEQENNAINAKYPGGEPPESALSPEFQEQRRNWRERSKQ